MKVRELIAKLQELDPDLPVGYGDREDGFQHVMDVGINEDYPDGYYESTRNVCYLTGGYYWEEESLNTLRGEVVNDHRSIEP